MRHDDFPNCTILVAGASGSIGRAIGAGLLAAGASVLLLGRSMARLRAALPSGAQGRAELLEADLTDPAAVATVGSRLSQIERIDALVLSSGIYERSDDPVAFGRQIAANVLGPYALIQVLLPMLVESQGQVLF